MSAIAKHWEQITKERLVELAMTKGFDDKMTAEIARRNLHVLNDLLEHTRMEAWQDGHDTALIHGQSENPHYKENQ